jgi:hypothetical protein
MYKKNYSFDIEPLIAIGYSKTEWATYIQTLVIHRVYVLCFVLTIYYNK